MAAFRDTLRFAQEFPRAAPLETGIRRFRVSGFPYVLVLHVSSNQILALAHTSRRSGYWRDRL